MGKGSKAIIDELRQCPRCGSEVHITAYKHTITPAVAAETEVQLTIELTGQGTFDEAEKEKEKKEKEKKKKEKGKK